VGGAVDTIRRRLAFPTPVALGMREGRRILTSPVYLAVALLILLTSGVETLDGNLLEAATSAESWYSTITLIVLLYAGLLTYAAAHLVTSSARRTGAERMLEASPVGVRSRSGGQCLGVVLGPGIVTAALAVLLAVLGVDLVIVLDDGALSVAELAQMPLVVVGGGLFGVLTATWLRFPGSLPAGLVALVMGSAWLSSEGSTTRPWFAPYTSAESWLDSPWTRTGSHAWHAGYLAGLCALAVCGVMLREREGRLRWGVVSALVVVATVLAGAAQL
jgi:hypothetical protein